MLYLFTQISLACKVWSIRRNNIASRTHLTKINKYGICNYIRLVLLRARTREAQNIDFKQQYNFIL